MVPLPKRSLRAEAKGSVAGGARFLSNASAGIKLWVDWFGEGKVVPQDLAEQRASICAICLKNDRKKSILEWFTAAAAREIMAVFSALNDLNLHTSKDEELKVCTACDCPMKAKVWTPLPLIKKHLSQERFNDLAEDCWIRHEKTDPA
jgi:disulfide oxidoreductase YuzD